MALTASVHSNFVHGHDSVSPVAASTKIYGGSAVDLDSSGNAVEAGTGVVGIGYAADTVDNSAGIAGAQFIRTVAGTALRLISGTDAVARADIGSQVGFADGNTVKKTATGHRCSVLVDIITDNGITKAAVYVGVPSTR
jgi:hypothetical protein